jgi:hypothetical protein
MTEAIAGIIRRIVVASGVAAVVLLLGACIIAQSSGDVPRLPETRPTIVHPEVVPPTGGILTRWPPFFTVPVELSDPTAPFSYAAFIDYNPLTGEGRVAGEDNIPYDQQGLETRIRTLEIPIPQARATADRCHVIEVVVALRFTATNEAKNAHTPAPPGGDSVTWIYNPGGDPSGCPRLDAGIEASFDAEGGL